MSSRRFELLLKLLHLNDSRKQPAGGEPGHDKLYKVRPLLDAVVKNFQSNYTPIEKLLIDESMIGFKWRLAFLQYMPKKPQKWGMKAWVLADAANGYVETLHRQGKRAFFRPWTGTSYGEASSE